MLSPPQLPGNAPVPGSFHPVAVGVAVLVGNEPHASVLYIPERLFCQHVKPDEPLLRKPRLDNGIGAFGKAHLGDIRFFFFQTTGLFQEGTDLFTGCKTVLPHQDLCRCVQRSVQVQNIDHGQFVTQPYLVVVDVVSRGDLQAARPKVHGDIRIGNDRYFLVYQRNKHLLTYQVHITLVQRIDANGHIGHDGLGPGGGYGQKFTAAFAVPAEIIFQVI